MGRHAAPDESPVDPLVADALAQRTPDAPAAHRDDGSRPGQEGPVGWPGPPPAEGGGIGWPDGGDGAGPERPDDDVERNEATPGAPAPVRGWRRFLRVSPAA
jgi:hypothetical protein